jgi:DNA-binding NarL/FixJ family response regulator
MPDLTGIELARRIARDYPAVRLLTLTVHEDPGYLHETLAAGVRGYLLKRSAADELVRAIRAVAAGGLFLDPAIAGKAVAAPQVTPVLRQQGRISAREAALSAREAALSAREEDVLRQTARGMGNKEIAAYLEISTKTVETYKARAIEKLGLRTRSDIVRYGAARGWLSELGSPASRP